MRNDMFNNHTKEIVEGLQEDMWKITYTKCDKCASDFSCFFLHATLKQKKELITEVARQANEEQRKLLQK